MEFVDVTEEMQRLEAEGDWGKIAELSEMVKTFPDLRLFRDHYGILKYCSAEANSEVDMMEMDSCHNCDGQPLKMWAYVTIDQRGTKLYSDPPVFIVADQNQRGFGEVPREDWQDQLEASGISRQVILKVRWHLMNHPPIDYFD
jgi:hypothetical protein